MVTLTAKRQTVSYLQQAFRVSERWACRVLGVHRASCRYVKRRVDPPELVAALLKLAAEKPRYGYQFLTRVLRRQGHAVNRKRI